MTWWSWAIVVAVALASLYMFLGSQAPGRNSSRYDFQNALRGLLILRENGSYMNIKHAASGRFLRVYRESGEAPEALLMVRVPSLPEVQAAEGTVRATLENQGLAFTYEAAPLPGLAIPVPIPDIWAQEAGASAARVAHLVLDSWGLGPDEKFHLRLEGLGSWRAMKRMRAGHQV
jgi:hypothetical protein